MDPQYSAHTSLVATATYDAFDPRPSKRSKTTHGRISEPLHPRHEKPKSDPSAAKSSAWADNATGLSLRILAPEFRHLEPRYEFTTMSIISSSKIKQKVSSLLKSLEKFSFADTNAKPGVVVLTAKSNAAAKMVSIVEIVKRSIDKEKARWYEYSRLHGEITELKLKAPKIGNGGETLQEGQEQSGAIPGEAPNVLEGVDVEMAESETKDVDETDFENMKTTTTPANDTVHVKPEVRKKVRAVPVMVTYMTRVSIPEFKTAYG